ncbi:MAG: acetate--CoA ligase family protein [Candidatus Helarchaeota archaeon]
MSSSQESSAVLEFQEIINAKSIAVIGASGNPNKLGYHIVRNLVAQGKTIYPINPNITEVLNLKTYPSIQKVPDPISVAVIIVAPKVILKVVEDCGLKGIKYLIIIAEGFRETGPEGAQLQDAMKKLIHKYNMRAIGPNTMGFHDAHSRSSICFIDASDLKPGGVSISSQTGVLAGAFLKFINLSQNIGISKVIDLGNMIDLDHADVLEFLLFDPTTEIIAMHMEGISDGAKFTRVLNRVTAKKPVIIIKGGIMPETHRVVASHTGSIAGDNKIFDGMLKKAGAIRVENFAEFVDVIKGFSCMPPPKGNRVAVVSGSGGTAVITIDALLKSGLQLADFSEHTITALKEFIPEHGKVLNPVDVWPAGVQYGLAKIYSTVISILKDDPQVDALVILLFRIRDFRYDLQPIIDVAKDCNKPIFFATIGHIIHEIRDPLEAQGFPTYRYGEQIAKVLGYMWNYQKNRSE